MNSTFADLVKKRRTIYHLGRNMQHSVDEINEIIYNAIHDSPSAFNSQSARFVVLFNEHHDKLWEIAKAELKKIVPEDQFEATETRINSFKAGFGTVLFFEDSATIENLQEEFALYAENFPKWSEQSTGINLYGVWLALADNEIGASVQHYNPLIDEEVFKTWEIPSSWCLKAQMPFGSIESPAAEKAYLERESRFKTFK